MAKTKAKKKKGGVTPKDLGFDFYVITNSADEYLVDWDPVTKVPTWGTNFDAAFWTLKLSKAVTFIAQKQIQNATATGKNGVHPSQRPPF